MILRIYVDARNFAEHAGYARPASLAPYFHWKHGHYATRPDTTYVFCPDAFSDDVGHALVHELARHWLTSHCPRYSCADALKSEVMAGYGPRIGLPALLAEAPFDVTTATFDLTARDTPSMRMLRSLEPAWLLPWGRFFLIDAQDLHLRNNRDPVLDGKGEKGRPPVARVFAAQATAACHYMYNAQGGRMRPVLTDYVTNQHRGDLPKLAPQTAFGASAEDVGAAILLYVGK
jgi:hypothetical protein